MSNELTAPKNVFDIVEQQQVIFNDVLSSDEVQWAKESKFAIQQLQNNQFLNSTAWGHPESLRNAIVNVAAIGISLNPANKHAYLVPRKPSKDQKSQVCLDISYMGLKHLAESSGSIEWMQAKLVYKNDKYINKGVDKAPQHDQQTFCDKGEIICAYCTVKLPNGDYLTEEMDIEALEKVKQSSKAQNGPWKSYPEEMMRKTVVKRAAKYWPSPKNKTNRINEAINIINEHEGLAEQETYSEEEKKTLDRLLAEQSSFSLCAFMAACEEEKQTALFNSFAKGEISSNKKLCRELSAVGYQEWDGFAQDVRSYIASDDASSLKSELDDFEPYEKKMLANLLGEEDTNKLKALING